MKINKRCLSAFSRTKTYLALGTKSKLFDTSFSLTSELSLFDYSTDTHYPTLQLDRKFCKLVWCEKNENSVLATGNDNGMVSLYEPSFENNSFTILNSFNELEGDVLGLDFNSGKNVLAAGSSNGKIIFVNLDKIDQQYRCDIPINGNITSLSWNKKVSRILCAGMDDGRILVLDIRAKNIAMTLESPEIKTVSAISWHPKCPTSIFASTNLDCLSSFNLSTDSSTTIGNQKSLGFEIVNENTLISFSKDQINYIDIDSLEIKGSESVDGLFEASFSFIDPLCCLSTSNGTTTVMGRRDCSILPSISQAIYSNYIISSDKYKIEYPSLCCSVEDDLSHSIMKLVYERGKFNLSDSNRKEVANLILESLKKGEQTGEIVFDLKNKVIESLIRHEFDKIERGTSSVDLRFVLDLFENKQLEPLNNPVEVLLSLIVNRNFDSLIELFPVGQWKEIICVLLFSDCSIEKCTEIFKKIEVKEEKDKGIVFLLNNNPEEYLNTVNTTNIPPKSVFEVCDFFSRYLAVVEKIKALGIKTDNKYVEEFLWYARDRGLYDLVKDLKKKEEIGLEKLSINKTQSVVSKPLLTSPPTTKTRSFNPSEQRNRTNLKPPGIITPPIGRTITSTTVPKPTGFSTRPPVRQPLYSCSSSGSTHSFVKPVNETPSGTTYGSEPPKPCVSPSLPKQSQIPTIPKPGQSIKPPSPSQPTRSVESNYDVENLTKEFEAIYANLREEAGKKNNLIIGNKIKDANRRFSVFANLDKQTLTKSVLHRVSLMVQTFKEVSERALLKQSVKLIVEESNELQENQCNIWMPSIYILVQLVY